MFTIGVLWLLESLEPAARSRFDLTITTKHSAKLRPDIEHALQQKGISYELRGSSPTDLHYEVTVPFTQKIKPVTNVITCLDGRQGTSVQWEIKKFKTIGA